MFFWFSSQGKRDESTNVDAAKAKADAKVYLLLGKTLWSSLDTLTDLKVQCWHTCVILAFLARLFKFMSSAHPSAALLLFVSSST